MSFDITNGSKPGDAPGGPAGGDLAGTYPNPTVKAIESATTSINLNAATAPTNGQVLTATSGTAATWQTPATTSPAGSNTQVQFNDSGSFGASSTLSWDKVGSTLTLAGQLRLENELDLFGSNYRRVLDMVGDDSLEIANNAATSVIRTYINASETTRLTSTGLGILKTPSTALDVNGTATATLFSGPVTALKSATTSVNVSSATAPTNGQVLTATGGTAATWQTASGGSPASPSTSVQYNNSGSFGGSANFEFDGSNTLTVINTILSQTLQAQAASTLNIFGYTPSTYANGNSVLIRGGSSGGSGVANAGDVALVAGDNPNASGGVGGKIQLFMGSSNNGTPGTVTFSQHNGSDVALMDFSGKLGVGGQTTPAYSLDATGDINCTGTYRSGGTAGVASFTGAVTSITIKNGIVTAIS